MFGFLMRYSNVSFPEALKELARKAGVRLPSRSPRTKSARKKEAAAGRFFEVNGLVCSFFQPEPHGLEKKLCPSQTIP